MAIRFRAALMAAAFVPITLTAAAGCSPAAGQAPAIPRAAGPAAHTPGGGIPTSPGSAPASISETGSTLLYPLFGAWATAYHRQFPNVSLSTAETRS